MSLFIALKFWCTPKWLLLGAKKATGKQSSQSEDQPYLETKNVHLYGKQKRYTYLIPLDAFFDRRYGTTTALVTFRASLFIRSEPHSRTEWLQYLWYVFRLRVILSWYSEGEMGGWPVLGSVPLMGSGVFICSP